MGKKRKHTEIIEPTKKDDSLTEGRPKRTLLGWKDKIEMKETEAPGVFRNKEKVLVTCSRRINFRWELCSDLNWILGCFCDSRGWINHWVLVVFVVCVGIGTWCWMWCRFCLTVRRIIKLRLKAVKVLLWMSLLSSRAVRPACFLR